MSNEQWNKGRPIMMNGQSVDAVQDCIAQNWDTSKTYIYETNPERAIHLVGIPSKESVLFEESLGYVAAIACTSADGYADVRVDDFLDYYGFYD